jgi:thiol-activated cytolysin
MTLSVDLPGLKGSFVKVEAPTYGPVQEAINGLLARWNVEPASEGWVNAERSRQDVTTAYTSQQAALDLGFNASWLGGEAGLKLNVGSTAEKTVIMACYRQVFYTVTMDTPTRPSAVFDPSVDADEIREVFDERNAPAYVRSVDYGRILLLTMETTARDTNANMHAALKVAVVGDADVNARYAEIIRNAKFSAFALGGTAGAAATFDGKPEDLQKLRTYIAEGARYGRGNPGLPIAYTVAFLKDNLVAKMGFTTDYTEAEYAQYPEGFVEVHHDGIYIAKFEMTWEYLSENGVWSKGEWSSGNQTKGYTHKQVLPPGARNIHVRGWAMTGLVWNPWGEVFEETEPTPKNQCYRVFGTTLNRKCEVLARP